MNYELLQTDHKLVAGHGFGVREVIDGCGQAHGEAAGGVDDGGLGVGAEWVRAGKILDDTERANDLAGWADCVDSNNAVQMPMVVADGLRLGRDDGRAEFEIQCGSGNVHAGIGE